MEIEQLIKRITEEVYEKLQTEGTATQSSAPSSMGIGKVAPDGLIYTCMSPNAKIADIQNACKIAVHSKCAMICVPQWFVTYAKEQLGHSSVKIATMVGLPGGTTSSFAKYAETKQAVVSGASTVIIPVNMQFCIRGDIDAARNDLTEVIVPTKKRASAVALIEVGQLSGEQLSETARMCVECGVDGIMLSYNMGGKPATDAIKTVAAFGVGVGVFGGISDLSVLDMCKQAGATIYATSRF